jgi:hypothetical protein
MIGALMLLPYGGAFWLALKIVNACAKRGGVMRSFGVLASLILGGVCVGLGYWGAFVGYEETRGMALYQVTYPVWGWIGIVAGGLLIIFLSLRSLTVTKQEIESEAKEEQTEKELEVKKELEEEARKTNDKNW